MIPQHIRTLAALEGLKPIRVWYMSFLDPQADKFLGASLVWARGPISAMRTAFSRGCNPGGQAVFIPVDCAVPKKWMNRLLTKDDVDAMDAEIESNERPDSDPNSSPADLSITDR